MIVKIQRPLFAVGGGLAAYLMYNEDRSVNTLLPMGEEAGLDDAMRKSPKRYFFADLKEEGEVDIDFATPCEDQSW